MFSHPYCLSCRHCCTNTEMILLREDVERIEKAGFRRDSFAELRNGFLRLKNREDYCVFLGENGRCTIYDYRPLGCRVYPLIYDMSRGVVFDQECPLVPVFRRRRGEIIEALRLLEYILVRLEAEYSIVIDRELFRRTKQDLLQA